MQACRALRKMTQTASGRAGRHIEAPAIVGDAHLDIRSRAMRQDLHAGCPGVFEDIGQFSADYNVSAQWTVGLLADVYFGARRSDFGSLPQKVNALLWVTRYLN
jgi:hypothetical protein